VPEPPKGEARKMSVISSTRFLALPLGELSPKGTERAKTKRRLLDNQIFIYDAKKSADFLFQRG
jgi:hypothetical protein